MINWVQNSLSIFTPEGDLTLWGTYQHFKQYIYDSYRWNQISTQEEHESRIRRIIERAIPDHNSIGIELYPNDFPGIVRNQMEQLGKTNGGKYDDDTLNQFEYLIRYVLETAVTHYLRMPEDSTNPKTGIFLGHSDIPAVRHYLYPNEELEILKCIIPNLSIIGEARLTLVQMASGERENECCGANWSMLEKDSNTGVCKISMPQTTVLGKNDTKLGGKSENAPRIIVISDFVFELLMDAKNQLLQQWLASGHTKESFDNLPLGCHGCDLEKRCSTKNMTDYANQIFTKIGIRREELATLSAELLRDYHERRDAGLYADINDCRSPTCYLLRRSAATHMIALGYSAADRQYSMGHRIEDPTIDRREYSEAHKQTELHKKASLRPLLNPVHAEEHHLHPGKTLSLRGHEEIIIVEPGASGVFLELECAEPGDSIKITIEQSQSAPQQYTLNTRQIPVDCESSISKYPAEINIVSFYHSLYANQIKDFTEWLNGFFSEHPHS